MDKNPYLMAKLGLENNATPRTQRDCGFYAKYIFLFLSLIQFLIILGLVLFMVYGNDHAATESHLQGMSIWLQECRVQTGALTKEKSNLTSLLNASRSESRQITGQLNRLNITYRACTAEKGKLQLQLSQAQATIQSSRICFEIVNYFNATYPDKLNTLQAQLKLQALEADLAKKELTQENQRLQAQVQQAKQKEVACQQEVMQLQTQVQKVRELEDQVMREMQAAKQNVKTAVEAALPSQSFWTCNSDEVRTLHTTCLNLSKQLDTYMAGLGQRLEDRVNAVAKENGLLQKEKVTCSQDRQELSSKLASQEQRAAQEKDALQLACSTEKAAIFIEQQKLFTEKDNLRQELDRLKQKCWGLSNPGMRVPGVSGGTNPIAGFPGNFNPILPVGAPNNFNPSWPRTGGLPALASPLGDPGPQGSMPLQRNLASVGHIGSHRTSSRSGYDKLEDSRKPVGSGVVVSSYKPLLKPTRQPSS